MRNFRTLPLPGALVTLFDDSWRAYEAANQRVKSFFVGKFRLVRYPPIREEIVRSPGREEPLRSYELMTYTPQHIANYFLDRAAQEGGRLSVLKLLKLVYIAYGWSLALRNEKLFSERIEAWQHGPVIPSIYHEFKHYGSNPIASHSVTVDFKEKEGKLTLDFQTPRIPSEDGDTTYILDTVWKSYKDFTAWTLRELTHQEGTPWRKVYRDGVRGIAMQDEDIREHYVERIGRYLEAARATEQERKAS